MITPVYAALMTFILVYLAIGVIRLRRQYRVGTGDGGHDDLQRAIRAHGNFVETAPWGIFLIFLVEYQDGNVFLLHTLGLLLVTGRILHIQGIKSGTLGFRVAGMAITLTVFAIAALCNIYLAFTVGV